MTTPQMNTKEIKVLNRSLTELKKEIKEINNESKARAGADLYKVLRPFAGRGTTNTYRGIEVPVGKVLVVASIKELGYQVTKLITQGYIIRVDDANNIGIDDVFSPAIELKILESEIKQETKLNPNELKILKSGNIFAVLNKEFVKKSVGEDDTKTILSLVTVGGRLCENASPTSTNLCVNSKSGAGKDANVSPVADLFEDEKILFRRTKITNQAFSYWKQPEIETGFTWDGKIVYLEDVSNSFLNCDTFKTMASGGSRATITKDQKTVDILIKGKPVLIITTAESEPKEELLRRFPLVYLDETKEQTQRVIKFIGKMAAGKNKAEYNPDVVNAIRCLEPYEVVVDFSEALADSFLKFDAVMFRTHFGRILDFVKFSAVIHQYSREQDEQGRLIATWADWDLVLPCVKKITQSKVGFNLTHKQKVIVDSLKASSEPLSVPEIMLSKPPYSEKGLYKALDRLVELGVVSMITEEQEKRKDVKKFKADAETELDIPDSATIIKLSTGGTGSSFSSDSTVSTVNNNEVKLTEQPEQPELKKQPFSNKMQLIDWIRANQRAGNRLEVEKQFGFDLVAHVLDVGELYEHQPDWLKVLE